MTFKQQITVAFTGASGAKYGLSLVDALIKAECQVFLLISSAARVVFATEENVKISGNPEHASDFFTEYFQAKPEQLKVFGKDDWFSPVASGSSAPKQMLVCPCSTGSLSAIATGKSDNLIERAADVVIKERGQLILLPRETPFSTLHLENMLKLSKMGVTIMPAAPGFYHSPNSIQDLVDFMVARMLDHLNIQQKLVEPWGYQPSKREL